jgi:flagellar biosynthetic protein FliP
MLRLSSLQRLAPVLAAASLLLCPDVALAQEAVPALDQAFNDFAGTVTGDEVSTAVRMVMVLTALTFVPALILVMTPFTRFIIVFSLLRQALGLQQSPPSQVLIGLSLFLSALVMQPTIEMVKTQAIDPYVAGEMQTGEAIHEALQPMRAFMVKNIRKEDLGTILRIARMPRPHDLNEVSTSAITSAFLLSELKTAFIIAVKVYLPFLMLDIVVASILLGMGMMVLPPVVISLPFKLLMFVLMDGWALLVTSMVESIR